MEEILVNGLEGNELEDFTEVAIKTLKELCLLADKYNFDRDNMVKYFAQQMTVFSEITTLKNFDVS